MRKLKLFLAACALMMGWSNAVAQASYIHSWTEGNEVAGGKFFLYNIGAGRFLDNGMNWGTRATVDNAGKELTLTLSGGKYTINTGVKTRYGGGGGGDFLNGGYMDGASMEWTFNSVSVAGYTNVYTLQTGDNYLVYQTDAEGDNPACNVTSLPATGNNGYWLLITKAEREAVKDYTFMLDNTCFNRPWEHKAWTLTKNSTGDGGNGTPNQSGGNVDNRCAESFRNDFTYLQNATGTVAEGRYKLYNQGFYRLDGGSGAAQIAANNDVSDMKVFNGNGEGTAASMAGASTAFSAGQYVNSVETFVNTGSLSVGVKNANNMNWVIWSNFYLEYLGQCVMDYAVELPVGGAMAADTWYYFDIAAAADNYTATATTLGDIICVNDGYALISSSGNVTLTATDNSFAAKRYYVKSSSANNLEIAVASYTYSISEAAADVSYIQKDNTVTVSYTVSTNDPGATLTQNYSGVTFGGESISVTPTASGFTFTVPTVSANTPYTLSIPEGAIKYNDENKNAAQNITLTSPAVFDGIYFLKVAATYDGTSEGTSAAVGKYLARGLNYGTHATLDKYGLPVQITTDGNNATTIQAYDTKRYFFHSNSWDCYADQASLAASGYFTVTQNNGKLLIHNNTMAAGTYLKYNTSAVNNANIGIFDDGTGNNNGPIIMWTTENASSHVTVMQSYKDGQAATAAAAAYASGKYASLNGITTVSALEAELEANYIKGDFVSPSAIESISEKYQGNQPGSGNTTETVYSNTINITEPGFYKFSMQAFYRAGGNGVTQEMHTKGIDFPPVVLFFGDSETQIKSIYDDGGLDKGIEDGYFETETVGGAPVQYNGKWYTNGQHNSVIIFQKDYYHNDVYFYAPAAGEYTYGVKYMGFANANQQWFIYSPESVEITSYAAAADAADYTALEDAIDIYDAATWGFEAGEYAPYNNVEAMENIAAAKAINKGVDNSKLLVNSLTTKLALSATNAAEVNAIANANFASNEAMGWTFSAWGEYVSGLNTNTNASNGTARSSNAGTLTYGNQTGYTMPLKASTVYRLTFKVASWDNSNKNTGTDVSVLNSSSEGLATKSFDASNTNRDQNGAFKTYTTVFETGAAGNYTLVITAKGGRSVYTDIELKKAVADVVAINEGVDYTPVASDYANVTLTRTLSNTNWNTFCVPFDIDNATLAAKFGTVEVAEFSEASVDPANATVNFNKMATPAITANKPVLLKTSTAPASATFNGVVIKTGDAKATGTNFDFVGSYKAKSFVTTGNYYLSANKLYKSAKDDGTFIKGTRAYIEAKSTLARITNFSIDGEETTAIEGLTINAAENAGKLYNLQGQEVKKAGKGLYIQNGKKVVIK